jgi:hypothetical protein
MMIRIIIRIITIIIQREMRLVLTHLDGCEDDEHGERRLEGRPGLDEDQHSRQQQAAHALDTLEPPGDPDSVNFAY